MEEVELPPPPPTGAVIRTPASVIDVEEVQAPAPTPGDLNDQLLGTSVWSDQLIASAGIPIYDVQVISVGGGIGSFVLADHLRIAGMPTNAFMALSNIETPWQTYEYLTKVSQIPRPERLRSDSTGMPDNIWGFPSYALRESRREKTLAPLWSVLTEPVFTDYWTPRAGTAFEGMAREAARIGWHGMVTMGQVRMVRRREGGGYFTILTPPPGASPTKRIAYRSQFVHLAVGYPGLRFLSDLQAYRTAYGDIARVVNAYEPHEHVYDGLLQKPGRVLVRGGGIVASRVLQRLMEDRMHKGAQTQILHLFRTYIDGKNAQNGPSRRKGSMGFAYQGFNWPKGAWGGQLKDAIESAEGAERAEIYKKLGGTHTPRRKLWQQQMRRAAGEGWYHTFQGEVTDVRPGDGGVVTTIRQKNGSVHAIEADVIIDCTGLEADLAESRILADLLEHSGAGRNPMGRLDVERTFEVRGTRNGVGRLYASGAPTLGGYYAGVDSFLGLQYAALRITDDLAAQGIVKRIGVGRSMSQWWKWFRQKPI
ncbi:MAG: hypothetical protein FJW83_00365 [Actinobacteria bacterium]|nr:hypothetical protein [Actinomycetota bacterium]